MIMQKQRKTRKSVNDMEKFIFMAGVKESLQMTEELRIYRQTAKLK